MSEAFNSVIVDARGKPIITMLEEIRVYLMERWVTKRKKVTTFEGNICPKVLDRLRKENELTKYWIPRLGFCLFLTQSTYSCTDMCNDICSWSGEKIFEVRHISMVGDKYTVNVDAQHCSCRKWLLTVIPCCHAIAAMNFINVNVEDFIPICFRRSTYEEIYQSIIFPVNGEVLWERTPYPDVHPPHKRILPGRPKKKRRLEEWELRKDNTQISKGGHRKKCSICHQIGHNRNNCPGKPVDEQTVTPAETAPDAQTAENAPTAETQTTQPLMNEAESQATPLPTPEEPYQQFRMKLQIRRRP